MMKRTRLVVAAATLAAMVATGTASAAASDSAPAPGDAKSGSVTVNPNAKSGSVTVNPNGKSGSVTVNPNGKSAVAVDADFAAIAAKLGVTTDRLDAALIAAKTSPATSTGVTPDAFVAAVAANLGLPVSRVQDALEPLIAKPAPGDDHCKQDSKDKKGVDGPQGSPFTTDAAAASVAAALGVDQAKAKAALTAVVALGSASGGVDPTSKAFGDIAASLGVGSDRLTSALADLKRSPANG